MLNKLRHFSYFHDLNQSDLTMYIPYNIYIFLSNVDSEYILNRLEKYFKKLTKGPMQ